MVVSCAHVAWRNVGVKKSSPSCLKLQGKGLVMARKGISSPSAP
jgi:hypothetical protein